MQNDVFANEKQKCGFATLLFRIMKRCFRIVKK